MSNLTSVWVLLVSTATIGFVHALAPDHWVPFVSIGRAQKWSKAKLAWITLFSGIGHVGSSIVIGTVGLILGFGLTHLESIESQRAQVAGLLLIGFGLAYAIWGLKQVRHHHHRHPDPKRSVTVWTLFAIFVLGPCEPLIPLMFVGAAQGWMAVALVSALFSVVTLLMMIGQTLLVYSGISLAGLGKLDHYSHAIAGLVIAVTGGMVMLLGI
jgi:sulfite exporter TauE/SafE